MFDDTRLCSWCHERPAVFGLDGECERCAALPGHEREDDDLIDERMDAPPAAAYIPCWSWNGYNSQEVKDSLSRKGVIHNVLKLRRSALRRGDDFAAEVIVDSDDEFTVKVVADYDFYGWRSDTTYLTTRSGRYVEDEDDNLLGTWYHVTATETAVA